MLRVNPLLSRICRISDTLKMRVITIVIEVLCLTLVLTAGDVRAGKGIRTMFRDSFQDELAVPDCIWLQQGTVLLLDSRVKKEERTLEIFDPDTGKRRPALDRGTFLANLHKFQLKEPLSVTSWPDAVDREGKNVIYLFDGDIFVVNLKSARVKRLTGTSAVEKAAAFSPDGKGASFIRDNDLYVVDLKQGKEKRLTCGGSDTLLNGTLSWVYWEEIYGHTSVPYSWSPDSTAVAYLRSDDSTVSISTYVHFKPATQEVVRQRYPKAGQVNPRVRLGIVDISSAKTTWRDCGEYEYLARFKWLPNSREIAIQTLDRKQSLLKLWFADKRSGRSRLILTEKESTWINLTDSPYFFKMGHRFIWVSERDGYRHLYLYRADGRLIRQVTRGNYMVTRTGSGRLSSYIAGLDEKKGLVYFTANKKALAEQHLYSIKLNGKGLKRVSEERGFHNIGFSPDMKYYLDRHSSLIQPGSLILFQARGKKISVLAPANSGILKTWNLTWPTLHSFKTRDGLELPAIMVKPQNFDANKKYPAVVYVYGGPGSQQVVDRWSDRHILWANLLAKEGYFYFVFEVRAGYGKSKAIRSSVYRQAYGKQNVRDILDGVKWLSTLPYIDMKRLGIWGGSGGGCTTLYVMTHSDVFCAGISLYPVSDWYYYDTIYTERYLGTPQANPQGYNDTSSVLAAENLKGRLLIVHGTYDDNVHPQNTYAFIDALIEKNIQFEIMIYPWRKHGVGDYPARVHLYTLMLDFWRRNLY